ncbi:glycosyltransferase family 2 protein [Paenibacillus montanisoli]|uniref:Glycosyltransferase 2-like domain-containing protein n=1 Tax=Paenibacillus montanisoli TaxID=2081970 RepID=A0A328U7N1_9BACL|nr:hypothetical protein [Paenibacillus montanisoli]RAP77401.1 hypothetical protein DL346_02645 [Paenibacillus montanisoli]
MQSRKSVRSSRARGKSRRTAAAGRKGRARAAKSGRTKMASPYSGKLQSVFHAGYEDASALNKSGWSIAQAGAADARHRMNARWTLRCAGRGQSGAMRMKLLAEGRAYADGFASALDLPKGMWQPVAMSKSAAAVVIAVPGMNRAAIKQLQRLPFQDIIVVLENGTEGDFAELRELPDITIMQTGDRLGADVGRAIGARMTKADIVLFADGGKETAAEQLALMLATAEAGADVVMADQTPQLGPFSRWDDRTRIRAFMNWSLGKPELKANSVELLPHVWSRHGIEKVGVSQLAVPPLAHLTAIRHKLQLRSIALQAGASGHASVELSVGDHIEALQTAMKAEGARLSFSDQLRRRAITGGTAT